MLTDEERRPSGDDVEVCIVSFNSAPVMARTLEQISALIPDALISIREHGSDPVCLDALRRLATASTSKVRVDTDPSNPGFGAGCNALAAESEARQLLFLNPDAELVQWPWSSEEPPPVGRVTGPVMLGRGESARQSGRSYTVLDEIGRSWLRRGGKRPEGHGFVSGAALLIDRKSFGRLAGFDARYFMFYEDIDLCFRANAAGVETWIDERWLVRHAGAHSTRSHFAESLRWSYESACRFHQGRGSSLAAYRVYVVVDCVLRSVYRAARRDREGCRAYLRLAQIASSDIVRRRRVT